jgi:predicted CoA-binding protein
MPTIAILGASAQRRKFGNRAVRAYLRAGYTVYPVNPHESQIEGLSVSPTLAAVPVARLDRISVYLPPELGKQLLPELVQKPAGEVWFNPGSADRELLRLAKDAGLPVVSGCSIVDVGISPHELD